MRTFKVSIARRLSADLALTIQTEVLVDDDRDAREEGTKAKRALDELLAGIGDSSEETA